MHIHHVNLNTGANWRNERTGAADPDALRHLRDALSAGHGCVIGNGIEIDADAAGRCLTLRVRQDDVLVITLGVAAHSRCGRGLWRALHAMHPHMQGDPGRPPQAPWCARVEHDGKAAALDTLERELAWAWIDYAP